MDSVNIDRFFEEVKLIEAQAETDRVISLQHEKLKREADRILDRVLLQIDEGFDRVRQSVNSGSMGL